MCKKIYELKEKFGGDDFEDSVSIECDEELYDKIQNLSVDDFAVFFDLVKATNSPIGSYHCIKEIAYCYYSCVSSYRELAEAIFDDYYEEYDADTLDELSKFIHRADLIDDALKGNYCIFAGHGCFLVSNWIEFENCAKEELE